MTRKVHLVQLQPKGFACGRKGWLGDAGITQWEVQEFGDLICVQPTTLAAVTLCPDAGTSDTCQPVRSHSAGLMLQPDLALACCGNAHATDGC